MKKLQNDYTTIEQSNQLLGVGLPADSADCYIYTYDGVKADEIGILRKLSFTQRREKHGFQDRLVPCWSAGRLIEILDICQEYCFQFDGDYDKWIPYNHCTPEDLVKIYSDKRNKFDFSKLN